MITVNPGASTLATSSPAYDAENVSVASGNYSPGGGVLATAARGFYVGGTGNVVITTPGGNTVTFYAVPAGAVIPVTFTQILQSGTTATNIVAMV